MLNRLEGTYVHVYNDINNNLTLSLYLHSYKDRYYDFIKWLESYSLPIYLLLLFIIIICIINNDFCFNIDIFNRKKDTQIMYALGISKKIQLLKKEGIKIKNNKVVDFESKLFRFK